MKWISIIIIIICIVNLCLCTQEYLETFKKVRDKREFAEQLFYRKSHLKYIIINFVVIVLMVLANLLSII